VNELFPETLVEGKQSDQNLKKHGLYGKIVVVNYCYLV